ncbi:hypothetical protein [Dactylosporangium sp. CA-139066]|uniref:hypothetical protein n=1 Tax=Dactylosporangium sp. CA-139066 TaxID=3239930 RepID=UPI003D8B248D
MFNQAALLASDLGLPDLAREWCHWHARLYLEHCPLTGMNAIRALEPLVNLARLHIRAGHGRQGHELLLRLQSAVTTSKALTVDGLTVPANLTTTTAERDEVRQWLWRVVLADGTRALTTDGHWQAALEHLHRQHGIGTRMLDGRQVAVIAAATTGNHAQAQELLAKTAPGEPWENAITACLTAHCRPTKLTPIPARLNELIADCRRLDCNPSTIVFNTRLVLSVADVPGIRRTDQTNLLHGLADRAIDAGDGYVARELLGHKESRHVLRSAQASALVDLIATCGLAAKSIPVDVEPRLRAALTAAARSFTLRQGSSAECQSAT